ncbi:hypothetical protein ACLK1T_02475 [Escherichia coli]
MLDRFAFLRPQPFFHVIRIDSLAGIRRVMIAMALYIPPGGAHCR